MIVFFKKDEKGKRKKKKDYRNMVYTRETSVTNPATS